MTKLYRSVREYAWDAFLAVILTVAWITVATIAVGFLPDPGPFTKASVLASMAAVIFFTLRHGRNRGYEDGRDARRAADLDDGEVPF